MILMSTHSVQNHLRVPVEEYDRAIRVFVPYYDEMLETGVEILKKLVPPHSHILELGSGTGRFSQAVLRGLATCRLTLLDIDPDILKLAKDRLASESDRVSFYEGSF